MSARQRTTDSAESGPATEVATSTSASWRGSRSARSPISRRDDCCAARTRRSSARPITAVRASAAAIASVTRCANRSSRCSAPAGTLRPGSAATISAPQRPSPALIGTASCSPAPARRAAADSAADRRIGRPVARTSLMADACGASGEVIGSSEIPAVPDCTQRPGTVIASPGSNRTTPAIGRSSRRAACCATRLMTTVPAASDEAATASATVRSAACSAASSSSSRWLSRRASSAAFCSVRSRMMPVNICAPSICISPIERWIGNVVPSLRCAIASRPRPITCASPVAA